LYLKYVLPLVGRLISRDGEAYRYLPESMSRWPAPEALAEKLRDAGFAEVEIHSLSFGIAVIHMARKGR
jgi:demethylmenaquinone methyltransferase / 2-methoxy-6-polyprenyl-1,4-benzoquinol methylase